jgi:hypothetical protein
MGSLLATSALRIKTDLSRYKWKSQKDEKVDKYTQGSEGVWSKDLQLSLLVSPTLSQMRRSAKASDGDYCLKIIGVNWIR